MGSIRMEPPASAGEADAPGGVLVAPGTEKVLPHTPPEGGGDEVHQLIALMLMT